MAIADYNPNIPLATDQPANSQGQLLDNFGAIDLIVDVNHYKFNAGANAGKHKFVQLPIQVAAPATAVDEFGMYTYSYVTALAQPAVTSLVIKNPNNGQRIPISSSGAGNTGWSWLASGLLMKWGVSAGLMATTAVQTLTYPVGDIPAFNGAAYSIMLTAVSSNYIGLDPDFSVYLQSTGPGTGLSFTYRVMRRFAANAAPTASAAFRWLAIGPATAFNL